ELGATSRPSAPGSATTTGPAGVSAETNDRVAALENFVRSGGGLVFFLGDQVNAEVYNDRLYRNGQGLLPLRLSDVKGDDTRQKWVGLNVEATNHPVVSLFEGANNPFSKMVKVFRWWGGRSEERRVG